MSYARKSELIYTAGIDGEGNICISRCNRSEINNNGTHGKVSTESLKIREDLYQRCALLNKKGR